MLQPVYVNCPKGHRLKGARASPGLLVRISGRCSACDERTVEHGFVTPFAGGLIAVHRLDRSTAVSAAEVTREMTKLAEHADADDFVSRLPDATNLLDTRQVLQGLRLWLHYRGRRGAAVPEDGFVVQIEEGTEDPARAIEFVDRFIAAGR